MGSAQLSKRALARIRRAGKVRGKIRAKPVPWPVARKSWWRRALEWIAGKAGTI